MASLFLQPEELIELTDYKYPKHQCEWLKRNGYPFDVSREGKPKVKRCLFTHTEQAVQPIIEEEANPNFEAI